MIRLEKVSKIYQTRKGEIKALDEINLHVEEGEFLVARGPSGSGKTTLLMTIGGMLRPTKEDVVIANNRIYAMSIRDRAKFRAENIGFVFQTFELIPYLNVMENVALPAVRKDHGDQAYAMELLSRFRISGRERHKPSELSVGERQRTAIARALFNRPRIILADEPTGNLDPENAVEVIEYLEEFHRNGGTVILATHSNVAEEYADRMVHLQDGRIEEGNNNQ